MKITFEKIEYKNVYSIGNVPITIDFTKEKSTLIVGNNGSGKSILLCAICYVLFNKTFRKTNLPNLINSINKSDLLVIIHFKIGNNSYKIERGQKPKIFNIYENGQLLNADGDNRDFQKYLESNILRTNYKNFIATVILGSASFNPFLSLPASERRIIIEELLEINIFSTMNVLLKDNIKKLKEEFSTLKYNVDVTKEKIKIQKENLKRQSINRDEQIEYKRQEIENTKSNIEKLQDDVKKIQLHVDVLLKKITDKSTIEEKKQKLLVIESKVTSNIRKYKKEKEFYIEHDVCQTCHQVINEEFKNTQLSNIDNKLNEFDVGMNDLNSKLSEINNRINEVTRINNHIIEHQKEIVKINSYISSHQEYIQRELKSINELSVETFDDNRLTELTDELESYNEVSKELLDKKKYYDFMLNMLKDGGVKTAIIKQYLPILNKLINNYLTKMNIFLKFEFDENFDEVLKSRYRDCHTYNMLSQGEKLSLDIAILFAFRDLSKLKNSISTNLLILDEILDSSLDSDKIDLFYDLIDHEKDGTNLFVISHRNEISEKFNRQLQFSKVKNFTRMQEHYGH